MTLGKFSWAGDIDEPKPKKARKHWRPKTRADCVDGPRPCPYVGCRHHLAMHVNGDSISRSGGGKRGTRTLGAMLNRGLGIDDWGDTVLDVIDSLPETCVLDVVDADRDLTLDEVAYLFGVSRERVRQIEEEGLVKLRKRIGVDDLAGLLDAMASGPHRETALGELESHATLRPGDVSAMREAKG